MSRIRILNTEVDNVTMSEAIDIIDKMVSDKIPSYIVTPNINHIVLIEKDIKFKQIYKNANLILTDGKPLIWISKIKKNIIKEKISGSDLLPKVCELAAEKEYGVFIFGADEGVAQKAADNLKSKYGNLTISGVYSPSYGFEKNKEEKKYIIDTIKAAKPDILVVALGSPKGEKFIYRYYKELNVPVSMSVGAAVDFAAGNIKRAPKWMSDIGLEWFYRILREPTRLAKRYFFDGLAMLYILWKYRGKR